jgi:hypothetical protein
MFAIYTTISGRIPILVKGKQKQDTLDEDIYRVTIKEIDNFNVIKTVSVADTQFA